MKWHLVARSCTVTYQSASHSLRVHEEAGNEGHRLVLLQCSRSESSCVHQTRLHIRPTLEILLNIYNLIFRTENKINECIFQNFYSNQLCLYDDAPSEDEHVLQFCLLDLSQLQQGPDVQPFTQYKVIFNVFLLEQRDEHLETEMSCFIKDNNMTICTPNTEWYSV